MAGSCDLQRRLPALKRVLLAKPGSNTEESLKELARGRGTGGMVPTVAHLTMTDIERKCKGISCILATDRSGNVQKLAYGQVDVSTDRTRASHRRDPTGRHTLGEGRRWVSDEHATMR